MAAECFAKGIVIMASPWRKLGRRYAAPTEQIEFHCVLVRMEAFEQLGPLDVNLLSACEHTDLCLLARQAGAAVYLEPSSVVTYVPPPPLESMDLPYFRLRWSDAWNTASLRHFAEKWSLAADDPSLVTIAQFLSNHRRLPLEPLRRAMKVFGRRPARWLEKRVMAPIEGAINRAQFPASRYVQPMSRTA